MLTAGRKASSNVIIVLFLFLFPPIPFQWQKENECFKQVPSKAKWNGGGRSALVCCKMASSMIVIEEFGNITLRRKLAYFESYGENVNLRSEGSLIQCGTITEQAFQAY